ncbi:hypothetical protein E2320_011961 [Naja naja]|nr:hypothetical protein E2320_011961 [Naja naja]
MEHTGEFVIAAHEEDDDLEVQAECGFYHFRKPVALFALPEYSERSCQRRHNFRQISPDSFGVDVSIAFLSAVLLRVRVRISC